MAGISYMTCITTPDPDKSMFPEAIRQITGNLSFRADTTGCSGDEVYLFGNELILKVSKDPERLKRERERTDFLRAQGLPGSESVVSLEEGGKSYYLRTLICGDSLIAPRFLENPERLIDALANVVGVLRGLDSVLCPFCSTDNAGNDFVHGDLCLPNIYVNERDEFAGFIDLDNSGRGDRWYDYAWLLWSMQYNLKTDRYCQRLLDKLGIPFERRKYEQYVPEEYRPAGQN